jgi:hypothetical protein
MGIFKVSHIDLSAGVQGVNYHPAVGRWASNFHPPVAQVFRGGRHSPFAFPKAAGLGKEVWRPALVYLLLALDSGSQEFPTGWLKLPGQIGHER